MSAEGTIRMSLQSLVYRRPREARAVLASNSSKRRWILIITGLGSARIGQSPLFCRDGQRDGLSVEPCRDPAVRGVTVHKFRSGEKISTSEFLCNAPELDLDARRLKRGKNHKRAYRHGVDSWSPERPMRYALMSATSADRAWLRAAGCRFRRGGAGGLRAPSARRIAGA